MTAVGANGRPGVAANVGVGVAARSATVVVRGASAARVLFALTPVIFQLG